MSNNKAFKVKNGLELADYNKSISDTAVDIFVYDTRKDSDGGAWRKRTQHTSWYNETLNTSTRGSRKEFPAVAVLVLELDKLTIYDGDDPDLPMWMMFNMDGTPSWTTSNMLWTEDEHTAVQALNGTIVTTNHSNSGIQTAEFIADQGYIGGTSATLNGFYSGNIEQRNDGLGVLGGAPRTHYLLPSNAANDVAMTVLPNAPIDASTGLPVPTIAVATDGGWSQISDDGNVYDFAFSSNPTVDSIGFTEDKTAVFWTGDSNAWTNGRGYFLYPLLTSDKTSQTYNGHDGLTVLSVASTGNYPQTINSSNTYIAEYNNIGTNLGLVKVTSNLADRESTLKSNNMGAYTTSSYNTGWMNGDIKLATLSDTDATNVTGSELVTNGDFATSSDWSYTGTGTGWSISGGTLNYDGTGGQYQKAYQNITVENGKTYVLEVELTALSGGTVSFAFASTNVGATLKAKTISSTGKHTITYTATSNGIAVYMQINTATQTFSFDNVTLRLAEADRSVNNNGLQVFGTVTKSAVATGADLVAYSGFSSSNYLQQPYNSDLDFGTGDLCMMGWTTQSGDGKVLLDRVGIDQEGLGTGVTDVSGRLYVYTGSGAEIYWGVGTTNRATGYSLTSGWQHLAIVRRNGIVYTYANGVLVDSSSASASVGASDHVLRLGTGIVYTTAQWTGSLALWRISATAPSPEQILKIYNDEKVLFQENAQATLYGSSDAVTALAYDDSTNILSVGTSAGRSDFQGLRRVNNTTNAVGAAISASNGLIVEE